MEDFQEFRINFFQGCILAEPEITDHPFYYAHA